MDEKLLKWSYWWMFRWCFEFSHLDVHEAYMSAAKYIPNIMYNTIGQKLNMSWLSSSFPSFLWVGLYLYGCTVLRPMYWYVRFCSGIYANSISHMLEMAETDEMLKLKSNEAFWICFCKSWGVCSLDHFLVSQRLDPYWFLILRWNIMSPLPATSFLAEIGGEFCVGA